MREPNMTIMKNLKVKNVPALRPKTLWSGVVLSAFALTSFGVMGQVPSANHDYQALKQADNFWGYFEQYCTECHNFDDYFGGVDFTGQKPTDVPNNPALFEKVLVKLRGRMMPPPNRIRPHHQRQRHAAAGLHQRRF